TPPSLSVLRSSARRASARARATSWSEGGGNAAASSGHFAAIRRMPGSADRALRSASRSRGVAKPWLMRLVIRSRSGNPRSSACNRASERIVEQDADAVEAFLESLPIAQRLVEPASELARPHRGAGLVDDQAGQVIGGGLPVPIQAKAAAGRRIKVHEGLWVFGMQRQAPRFEPQVSALDVAEECAGSRECFGPLVAAERGECLHPEQRQPLAD